MKVVGINHVIYHIGLLSKAYRTTLEAISDPFGQETISDHFRDHIGPLSKPYRTTLKFPGNTAVRFSSSMDGRGAPQASGLAEAVVESDVIGEVPREMCGGDTPLTFTRWLSGTNQLTMYRVFKDTSHEHTS